MMALPVHEISRRFQIPREMPKNRRVWLMLCEIF
jgi:hypothetical protein